MVLETLRLVVLHLALLLGPLVLAALVLHQLNVLTTRVLGGTFGSGAVVWFTGWLGTPVHELSHAAACVLFAHRIREIVLFRPDPATGVVGWVRYTWSPRNPWALLGHGLVGVAPLFGGALVLGALLFLLGPDESGKAMFLPMPTSFPDASSAALTGWLIRVQAAAALLFDADPWTRPSGWLFGYLVLCVGTHLAPSGQDLKGAWPSLLLLVGLLILVDLVLISTLGDRGTALVFAAASWTAPVAALLALAALLVGAALVAVWLVATAWSAITGRGILGPLRMLADEPWRLLAVGGVVVLVTRVV
jgi:hypothetical protein